MKLLIFTLVTFLVFAVVENRATSPWEPVKKAFSMETFANLLSNPTEAFTNALDKFLKQLGMQEWSVITFDPTHQGSNEGYEDVMEELALFSDLKNLPNLPGFINLTADCKLCMVSKSKSNFISIEINFRSYYLKTN